MSSTPAICSTIYSLDSAKSSRLVSDALGKFFPLTEYWKLYRTDIYRIHRVPANQTVPVKNVIPSRFIKIRVGRSPAIPVSAPSRREPECHTSHTHPGQW
jgi:hypothetical protein